MRPLSDLPAGVARGIDVVFSDIDDTITTAGKMLPEAFAAAWRLARAGIALVPITGRCAGWVDHVARMWPVRGVVGENGAFYATMDESVDPPRLRKRYFLDPGRIATARDGLDAIKYEVLARFPTCAVASDQPYREFDLAIDYAEDVPPLSLDEVKEIVAICKAHGANVKMSSIHVNCWFGDYDKLSMTKVFSKEVLGMDLDDLGTRSRALFIGDSPNDQPMFSFFPVSVGVANIRKFDSLITTPPSHVTSAPAGLGFAELVDTLLGKRSS